MQKVFQTVDKQFINEEHISMFQTTNLNGKYQIKIIVDYDTNDDYILYESKDETDRNLTLNKIKDMLSCSEWGELQDGSLFRINHIKYSKMLEKDGEYFLNIYFSKDTCVTFFQGTQLGLENAFKDFKMICYSVVYDLDML